MTVAPPDILRNKKNSKKVVPTTSDGFPPHVHQARIDRQGNGHTFRTSRGKGHKHRIQNFVIIDGDHRHLLRVTN